MNIENLGRFKKGEHRSKKTEFSKGIVPWNKGQKTWKNCSVCKLDFTGRGKKYCSLVCSGVGQKNKLVSSLTRKRMSESHVGVMLSNEHREKVIKTLSYRFPSGMRPWNYLEDRTKLKTDRRHAYDLRYREWSRQIKNRDYWKCQISNDDCSGRVEAHHILGWKDHPELRYEIKNGITLCHFHHPRKRSEEERYVVEFQQLVAAKMQ